MRGRFLCVEPKHLRGLRDNKMSQLTNEELIERLDICKKAINKLWYSLEYAEQYNLFLVGSLNTKSKMQEIVGKQKETEQMNEEECFKAVKYLCSVLDDKKIDWIDLGKMIHTDKETIIKALRQNQENING